MSLREDFRHKCQCYYGEVHSKGVLKVMMNDGACANILYRWAVAFRKIGLGFIGVVFLEINRIFNGCVIGLGADFGPGFVLMHPVGVVINGAVKGGSNVVIESGVVLGAARNGFPVEVPVIGDHVFIGAGAKVLGNIRIGNNVVIGANAVVISDIPDGCTAVGVPAKVVNKEK